MKSKLGSTPIDKKKRAYKRINLAGNILFILIGVSTIAFNFYDTYNKTTIYKSLDMKLLSGNVIEYGSQEFDVRDLVENVEDGVIKNYTKEVNTSEVGVQNITFELSNQDVTKTFTTQVKVVDTKAPHIVINKDYITIYTGTNFDIKSNVKSVQDEIDGDIKYSSTDLEEAKDYYTVTSNLNVKKAGSYVATVTAYDKNGNKSERSYGIKVSNKPVAKKTTATAAAKVSTGNYKGPSSVDTSSVVATARSLIGYRYVYAGESPKTGFDCSGFVKYVFSVHGKYVAHGTYAQAKSGHGVDRADLQPGDIILWSFKKGSNQPSHTSIYVGGDTIVHAATPKKGVIASSLSAYEKSKTAHIVAIRRL